MKIGARRAIIPSVVVSMILLLSPVAVEAQQHRTVTVDEAVQLALENNRMLEAARADAAAVAAALDQAQTLRLPVFSAQGIYTRLSDNVTSLDIDLPAGLDPGMASSFELTPIERDQIQTEVGVSQPILTGARIGSTIASARHSSEAARYRAKQAEVDAAYRVRAAFWMLVQAEASAAALETADRQMEAHLQDAENRLEEGAATNTEVLQIRTRLLEIRADHIDASNGVRAATMELNRLIGLPLDTRVSPATEGPLPLPDLSAIAPGAIADSALANHPELMALERHSAALHEQVAVARSDWFPDINAFGRYRYSRPNPYFFLDQDEFRGSWEAGVSATWTIWNWNRRGAAVNEAQARLKSARATEADVRESIELEAARRQLELERAEAAMRAAESALQTASESYRIAQGEYELGAALTSQVLDAEAGLRSAELRLARARADRALAQAAVLQVLGRVR